MDSTLPRPSRLLLVTNTLVTGGAEHMLVSLARAFRPKRVAASVACLKEAGPLASSLTECGIAVHENLLRHKADVFVVDRLRGIFDRDRIDVVCAVGSGGDRMFWSALAARRAGRSCMVWSHMHPTPRHPDFSGRPGTVCQRRRQCCADASGFQKCAARPRRMVVGHILPP